MLGGAVSSIWGYRWVTRRKPHGNRHVRSVRAMPVLGVSLVAVVVVVVVVAPPMVPPPVIVPIDEPAVAVVPIPRTGRVRGSEAADEYEAQQPAQRESDPHGSGS